MIFRTHTAYLETQINGDTFEWVMRILALNGEVLDQVEGTAESYDQARDLAAAEVAARADNYLKTEEEG